MCLEKPNTWQGCALLALDLGLNPEASRVKGETASRADCRCSSRTSLCPWREAHCLSDLSSRSPGRQLNLTRIRSHKPIFLNFNAVALGGPSNGQPNESFSPHLRCFACCSGVQRHRCTCLIRTGKNRTSPEGLPRPQRGRRHLLRLPLALGGPLWRANGPSGLWLPGACATDPCGAP